MIKTTIQFILTGGTIDLAYHQREGRMINKKNVEKILARSYFPHHEVLVERLFNLDSKDLTNKERQKIVDQIEYAKHTNYIITHGTDTLVDTAKFLKSKFKDRKRIILTGAMVPDSVNYAYIEDKTSDAFANVAQSVSLIDYLPKGVWIVFHGKVFDPQEAIKDYEKLIFYKN